MTYIYNELFSISFAHKINIYSKNYFYHCSHIMKYVCIYKCEYNMKYFRVGDKDQTSIPSILLSMESK